ncbi:cytochrome P460 family protein [Povalibacter sp.]|uniref:cytochrome P460 family protein n=1 Tax=Povalibacter sp. TaxID=1962978 RepID=UPI002F3FA49F
MQPLHFIAGPILLVVTLMSAGAEGKRPVSFPEGYRSWQHVKSILIGAEHPTFAERGGLHHYYANDLALVGYQTGEFPDGSVIVDEGLFTKEGEALAKGILLEADRRMVEVMVKDRSRYPDTAGWGFERFEREDKAGALTAAQQAQCYQCHVQAQDRDHVFSKVRF